jgi:uncharacterized protein Smg (DUF494 family)
LLQGGFFVKFESGSIAEERIALGDRVLEIVVMLMSHIRETRGQLDNLEDISEALKSQGFTENEISSAYSWILDQLQTESQLLQNLSHNNGSFRILSEVERQHLTPSAFGYLLQLKHLGLLNDGQMELVLERGLLMGPPPISLEQIKIIVGTVLFHETGRPELVRQPAYFFNDEEGLVN